MYFTTYRSRSRASVCSRILDRAQYDILLKCSVNNVKLGDFSSFCSCAHTRTSGISMRKKSSASNSVICSANSLDLKSKRWLCRVDTPRLVSTGGTWELVILRRRAVHFSRNFFRSALAKTRSPLLISWLWKSMIWRISLSSNSERARSSTTPINKEKALRPTRWRWTSGERTKWWNLKHEILLLVENHTAINIKGK